MSHKNKPYLSFPAGKRDTTDETDKMTKSNKKRNK